MPSTPQKKRRRGRQPDTPETRRYKKQVRNSERVSRSSFANNASYKRTLDLVALCLKAYSSTTDPYPTKDNLEATVNKYYIATLTERQQSVVSYPLTINIEEIVHLMLSIQIILCTNGPLDQFNQAYYSIRAKLCLR